MATKFNTMQNQQFHLHSDVEQIKTLIENGISTSTSTDLVSVGGASISLGQTTMSASLPIAIASNQSSLPTTESRLPTALGQTTMSASLPVAIASNQTSVSTNLAQIAGNSVSFGSGTLGNGVQRVCLPTDQTPVPIVANTTLQSDIYYINSGWTITSATTFIKPVGFAATHIGTPANVSSNQTWYIYSSNAGDTQQVVVEGYTTSGTKATETATLNGTTVVTLSGIYIGFTWFGAKGASNFAGNIFLSEQNSNAGTRAYCTIASGATTAKANINVIAVPQGKTLYIIHLSIKRLFGNLIHRLNMRKTAENSTTAITAGTANMLVDSWAIINNSDFVINGFRVPNYNTFTEFVYFECVGSNVDNSEAWIDVQYQLI